MAVPLQAVVIVEFKIDACSRLASCRKQRCQCTAGHDAASPLALYPLIQGQSPTCSLL